MGESGGFGSGRVPDPALVKDCVHCGFCLPACPTYSLWGEEMDSPRGRIHLIQQVQDGARLDDVVVGHFDACLGCLACVPACPSGVRYDLLISAAREQVETHHRRPVGERLLRGMIFAVFPRPGRLRLLRGPLAAYRRMGVDRVVGRVAPRLGMLAGMAPTVQRRERVAEVTAARGRRRARVGMLTGCVQREFFPGVNAATARLLAAEGVEVVTPRGQGCCGALSWHNGRADEAKKYANKVMKAFRDVDLVIANAAGCGSSLKEYGEILGTAPPFNVADVAEFLHELGPVATRHPINETVAYHDACHLANAQGITRAPRELLRQIPGLRLREIPDGAMCCGSAGVYNVLNPEPATELGDRKAAAIAATGAGIVVTANPGCLLQIDAAQRRRGGGPRLMHTVELLDASVNRRGDTR